MLTNSIQKKNSLLFKRTSINEPITLRLISQLEFETILPDKDIALESMDYLDKISDEEAETRPKTVLELKYNSNIIIISSRSADSLAVNINQRIA